jgi:hypothetical protein
MEAREFDEWMAYWAVEPWGEVRADYRAGMITAMVANSQGAKTKGRPFEASDFFDLYNAGEPKIQKQSGEQMLSFMKSLAGTSNG